MNRSEYLLLLLITLMLFALTQTAYSPVYDINRYPLPKSVVIKSKPKSILFLGDIMLGRYVEKMMESKGEEYPFKYMKMMLASSTYVVANLEGPIPKVHTPTPMKAFRFSFKDSVAPLLLRMNISAVSLANNHGLDWGEYGYINTKSILDMAKMHSFGHSQKFLDDVYETNLDGKLITIFGINMVNEMWNKNKALEVTRNIVRDHSDSYLIAFLHWGNEYDNKQNTQQQEFAHDLIDNGVDIIIGSHPHVVQGIEVYKGKPIFYSLGNFIFDQYFSNEAQEGYAVKIKYENSSMVFELTPYISEVSQPKIPDEKRANEILERIASVSSSHLRKQIMSRLLQ